MKKNCFVMAGVFLVSALLASCGRKPIAENKVVVSQETIFIEPKPSPEMNESVVAPWTNDTGEIFVLLGYGFNDDDFVRLAEERIRSSFGLSSEGGLVHLVVFPNDLRNKISNFYGIQDETTVRGIIMFGAPERTHITLAKIIDDWDGAPPFNILSFFPQDDNLAQEANCNIVFEEERGIVEHKDLDGSRNGSDESHISLILNSIRYVANLPAPLAADSELKGHVQSILGTAKFHPYIDGETGIQAKNHFVIEKK